MKSCCALFILFSFIASAGAEEFKAYVKSFDPDMDVRELESSQVEIISDKPVSSGHIAQLPPSREMDSVFKEAGLSEEVSKMDQMDKDLFYLNVQKRPMEYLNKKYATIQTEKIKKLKSMIGEK